MKRVDIPTKDYIKNHKESVAELRNKAKSETDEEAKAVVIAQAEYLEATPPPVVKRHVDVKMVCTFKRCPDPEFLATFDEVQRILACPTCGNEVSVPETYRGTP